MSLKATWSRGRGGRCPDVLTVVRSVLVRRVANLEAEGVAAHEVVPLDHLGVGVVV